MENSYPVKGFFPMQAMGFPPRNEDDFYYDKEKQKAINRFFKKYFHVEEGEIMEEDEIMECVTILITEGIFHDVRSLQIAIGRQTGILIPKKMIDDALLY